MSTNTSLSIRRAVLSDWARIRELCCLTGSSGEPIEKSRWAFFSELWIGPYQALVPQWTFVCEDLSESQKSVVGYVTGCPDTAQFERLKKIKFHPRLLIQILTQRFAWSADSKRYVRRLIQIEKAPTTCFSDSTKLKISKDYPAHLHINFDARFRGQGLGRGLMNALIGELKTTGCQGLHVYCGQGPLRFYLSAGFTELERIDYRATSNSTGSPVFALGLKLS